MRQKSIEVNAVKVFYDFVQLRCRPNLLFPDGENLKFMMQLILNHKKNS